MAATRSSARQHSTGSGIAGRVIAAAIFVVFLCAGLFMLFLSGSSLLDPDKTIREADQGILMLAFMGLAFCGFSLIPGTLMLKRQREAPMAEQATGTVAGPDRVQQHSPRTNIPNALRGQKPPRDAVIVAESPWSTRLILLAVAAMGTGMLYLGWNMDAIFPAAPGWAGYLPIAVGAALLPPVFRPMIWRSRHVAFIATHEGVYFQRVNKVHREPVSTPETAWLFVPWANVTDVREIISNIGGYQHQTKSIEFTFRVTPDEARDWFPVLDAQPGSDDKYQVVQLPVRAGTSPDMVPRLQQVSGLAGHGHGA